MSIQGKGAYPLKSTWNFKGKFPYRTNIMWANTTADLRRMMKNWFFAFGSWEDVVNIDTEWTGESAVSTTWTGESLPTTTWTPV